jgi:predicted aldo/keto reductase-like oxidoreductase
VTAGLAGLGPGASQAGTPRIRGYVTLGNTGLRVSDISFGSSRSSDPALVRHAAARGVTYFDTAESYRGGRAEEAIGEALRGERDRYVIASKHKAWGGETRRRMMSALEGSLRRLRTDYVDIYFNHAVNDVSRMQNPEWSEFTELAQRQGKIRFRGMSGHGSHLVECIDYALDHDLVDVVLAAYNFAQDPDFYDLIRDTFHYVDLQPELPRVLERARSQGVGVVAMKTLMGARMNDMRPYEHGGATFAQAALRWVLASGKADVALISMTSERKIDEFVAASGEAHVAEADIPLLVRYAALQGPRYCRHGCRACDEACPAGVEIPEVLRTRMYEVDYGDPLLARVDYANLTRGAGACLACVAQPCLGACPSRIPIAALTRDAALRFRTA